MVIDFLWYTFLVALTLGSIILFIGLLIDEDGLKVLGLVAVVIFFLALVVVWAAYDYHKDKATHERLMAQCLGDGKKEYECVSILRKPASQAIPVFIPIPTGR